jgi:hypothetical protein
MEHENRHFISVDQYTINVDRIDYIEQSEEWSTVVHFTGGRSLQLGEDSAKLFMAEMERVIGKLTSWR